nr:hypothetical protein CRG98_033999 [Ipomoea batatas]
MISSIGLQQAHNVDGQKHFTQHACWFRVGKRLIRVLTRVNGESLGDSVAHQVEFSPRKSGRDSGNNSRPFRIPTWQCLWKSSNRAAAILLGSDRAAMNRIISSKTASSQGMASGPAAAAKPYSSSASDRSFEKIGWLRTLPGTQYSSLTESFPLLIGLHMEEYAAEANKEYGVFLKGT